MHNSRVLPLALKHKRLFLTRFPAKSEIKHRNRGEDITVIQHCCVELQLKLSASFAIELQTKKHGGLDGGIKIKVKPLEAKLFKAEQTQQTIYIWTFLRIVTFALTSFHILRFHTILVLVIKK